MSQVELRYNVNLQTDFNRLEVEALSHTKEVTCKTPKESQEFKMITQKYLKSILEYDEKIGTLTWKNRRSGVTRENKVAGSPNKNHISITIDSDVYLAHRLVWLYYYGVFPKGQIDHIDGNGNNNAISNLRVVDSVENARNQKLPKNNKYGVIGVYKNNGAGKDWKASITVNGKFVHLGYFNTKDEAVSARKEAELKYGFHSNHGRTL